MRPPSSRKIVKGRPDFLVAAFGSPSGAFKSEKAYKGVGEVLPSELSSPVR